MNKESIAVHLPRYMPEISSPESIDIEVGIDESLKSLRSIVARHILKRSVFDAEESLRMADMCDGPSAIFCLMGLELDQAEQKAVHAVSAFIFRKIGDGIAPRHLSRWSYIDFQDGFDDFILNQT